MSTILNTNGAQLEIPVLKNAAGLRVVILTAEWNPEVTHALRDGAFDSLVKGGLLPGNICMHSVPGTVELVYAAARAARELRPDAIIVIGCVIRGDTPHFDYVCQQASQGVAQLNATGEVPVIFGVLTVNDQQQALDRAGGCLGNKGAEAGVAALEMITLGRDYASWKWPVS